MLTRVRVRGRTERGTVLGTFMIGEVRAERLQIVGPGLVAPAHADKVDALQDRYGIDLVPLILDPDPERAIRQVKECIVERFEQHLAEHPPKPTKIPIPYVTPEQSDHFNAAMALSRQAFELADSLRLGRR